MRRLVAAFVRPSQSGDQGAALQEFVQSALAFLAREVEHRDGLLRLMSVQRLKLILLLVTTWSAPLYGQIPFFTDDADTTEKGKFHLELFNEHDWLQESAHPAKRLNTSVFTLNYGLTDRIELGINAPTIKIFTAREAVLTDPIGIGDTQLGVKIRLRNEREHSSLPAMSVVFNMELPTGSTEKQIGSGLTDYALYGVLQESLTKRTTGRFNAGIVFAGNAGTGLTGIRDVRGHVFAASGSLVRDFSEKLKLGIELFGGVSNAHLSRSQLKSQLGAIYAVNPNFNLTFGLLAGRFVASPRFGFHLGLAYDFK